MKKIVGLFAFLPFAMLAAPAVDSPLWQSWQDTPMTREWKELMAKEAWRGNKLGIDHEVPPPWTPVAVGNGAVAVWGRQYVFDGKALPVRIVSQGIDLLNAPVRFVAVIDGREFVSEAGSGKVVSSFPDQAVYAGTTRVGGIELNVKFTIEFDGFVWVDVKIGSAPAGVRVERLTMDFPLRREVAQYYRKQSDGFSAKAVRERWGKVVADKVLGPMTQGWATDFGLANERVGIEFGCESTGGYLSKTFRRRAEWVVDDRQVNVRFCFIDDPPADRDTATGIEFFFNVMPYRELNRERMARFIYAWEAQGRSYDLIVNSPSPCVRIVSPFYWGLEEAAKRPKISDGCVPLDIPMPRNPEKFLDYMKKLRTDKPGTRIVHYVVGDLHSDGDPVFVDNAAAWVGGADDLTVDSVYAQLLKRRSKLIRLCGWDPDLADYKVWCFTYWVKKLGLDGFYWDDQVYTHCANPEHRAHRFRDTNGKRMIKRPIRPYREMAKRIYKVVKKHNPDATFIGHGYPPYVPFSDMVIDGEVLARLTGSKNLYTQVMDPEDIRNFYMNSHVDGAAKSLLPEHSGRFYTGDEAPRATRALMAFLWMSDLNVWIHGCSTEGLFRGFIDPRGAFRTSEAEYLPYHAQKLATFSADKVYCTVFRHKDRALIAVSNWNAAPVRGALRLSAELLPGAAALGKAVDYESGKPVVVKDGSVALEINGEDFRLIEVRRIP